MSEIDNLVMQEALRIYIKFVNRRIRKEILDADEIEHLKECVVAAKAKLKTIYK